MDQYKGVGIVFLRNFVQAHGETLTRQFLEQLSPDERDFFLHAENGEWRPVSLCAPLFARAATLLYPGDSLGLQHLGRERAKENFNGIYRSLLRVATIPFLVRQAAKLWRVSYDTGTARAEKIDGKCEAHFIVENYPALPETCREVGCGYIRGLIEFTKLRNIQVVRDDYHPNAWKWIITWE